ncbi:hypothetical protein [Desulfuribacillus stibiiarsenatis]|uniref:hypothetical protein n=1 Tax=Desulfuribacillus stibiiarsenatis TaxID=1390249 RepID=UPI0009F6A9C0|nr:hypothetical protein [Desulfuribacillus stibiiarsenatis]
MNNRPKSVLEFILIISLVFNTAYFHSYQSQLAFEKRNNYYLLNIISSNTISIARSLEYLKDDLNIEGQIPANRLDNWNSVLMLSRDLVSITNQVQRKHMKNFNQEFLILEQSLDVSAFQIYQLNKKYINQQSFDEKDIIQLETLAKINRIIYEFMILKDNNIAFKPEFINEINEQLIE